MKMIQGWIMTPKKMFQFRMMNPWMSMIMEDVIMHFIDESENEEVVYVPKLRTLTRGGRLAGTWQTCFSLDSEAESDEEANSDSDSVENDEPDNDSDSVKAVTSRVSKRVLSDSESASDSSSEENDYIRR